MKHDVLFVDYCKHWAICYDILPLYETDTHGTFVHTASNTIKSAFSLPILKKFIFITCLIGSIFTTNYKFEKIRNF